MRKKANKKAKTGKTTTWTKSLDANDVRQALDEALVDAYDDYGQHTALLTMIEEDFKFPFAAKVIGEEVTVVNMEWSEDDEFGLDLIVERNGEEYRVAVRSVELVPPFPNGHLYLAAYLDWRHRM